MVALFNYEGGTMPALSTIIVLLLGAAYLIYLGVRTMLSRDHSQDQSAPTMKSSSQLFTQGVLVNLLKPKTASISRWT